MKRFVTLLSAFLLIFSLVSCSDNGTAVKNNNNNKTETNVSSSDEMRELVVDYMRSMATVRWTPENTFTLTGKYQAWSYNLTYEENKTYYGLPFLTDSRGSLEEFKDKFVNTNTYGGPTDKNCVGNACYDAVYVALIQACPSITFTSTEDMLPANSTGLLPVGNWNWQASSCDTSVLNADNSLEVMAEAYAQLKPGDVVLKHIVAQDAGHARIVAEDPVIVYNNDGTIDPTQSYITTLEQTNQWDKTTEKQTTWWVDHKYMFNTLHTSNFVPLTCADYFAEKKEPEITLTGFTDAQQIAEAETLSGRLVSNYAITSVKLTVTDSNGKEVCIFAAYPKKKECDLSEYGFSLSEHKPAAGTYTFKLTATTGISSKTLVEYNG